jgi:hypothetical protein
MSDLLNLEQAEKKWPLWTIYISDWLEFKKICSSESTGLYCWWRTFLKFQPIRNEKCLRMLFLPVQDKVRGNLVFNATFNNISAISWLSVLLDQKLPSCLNRNSTGIQDQGSLWLSTCAKIKRNHYIKTIKDISTARSNYFFHNILSFLLLIVYRGACM